MQRGAVDNVVRLINRWHRCRSSLLVGYSKPRRQQMVEEGNSRVTSAKDADIAAIYKRAAIASGLTSKMLPDGGITVEQSKLPDFSELDTCLKELCELEVEPVYGQLAGTQQVG